MVASFQKNWFWRKEKLQPEYLPNFILSGNCLFNCLYLVNQKNSTLIE